MLGRLDRVQVTSATTGTGTLTSGSASSGYQTASAAGAVSGQRFRILIKLTSGAWEISTSTYDSAGPTWTRTLVSSSTGSLISCDGTQTISIIEIAADWMSQPVPQGRLTLTTATPVMTASATAQTTVYYTPYNGSWISLYDGTQWVWHQFAELSQLTTDSTKSPAACTTNSNYDLFVWDDAGTLRCTRGPAWTSDTGRGTGAATTELERVNGALVNKVAITNGPGAQKGRYVGTVRTNGSSQIDMIFGGTGAAGGESTILGVWNMYNRVLARLSNYDTTDTWAYTTATWRCKNNNTNNQIRTVIGLSEDMLTGTNHVVSTNSSANISRTVAIGLNSTTTWPVGKCVPSYVSGLGAGQHGIHVSPLRMFAPLGLNTFSPIEYSTASGTCTWLGDNGDAGAGTTTAASIFLIEIMA